MNMKEILKEERLKYCSTIAGFVICLLIFLVGPFKTFSFPWIIVGTITLILLVHLILYVCLDMEWIKNDSPHLILWMGLIGTFIGFSLSTSAAQVQQENSNKARLLGLLGITKSLAMERGVDAAGIVDEGLQDYKNYKHIFFNPVNIPVTNVLAQIQGTGEFYPLLSDDFIKNILFLKTPWAVDGISQMSSYTTLQNLRRYNRFIIENDYIVERINLEIEHINGKIPDSKLVDEAHELIYKFGSMSVDAVPQLSFKDYLSLPSGRPDLLINWPSQRSYFSLFPFNTGLL